MRIDFLVRVAGLLFLIGVTSAQALADASPFSNMGGLWSGQGRLGFKDGKVEAVTCRTTYFVSNDQNELKQTIRCASGGAKIEVKSVVTHAAGKLAGTWSETVYNKAGDVSGETTARGFRVKVTGSEVNATMDIIGRDAKQMVEIHFADSTLLGLTLILTKQSAGPVEEVGSITPAEPHN
jgi:hypothetical protein